MIARILSLLAGLAIVGAACLSNPTPHPGKPRPHEADPGHVGQVVDPSDDPDDDADPGMNSPTPTATADCDDNKFDDGEAADAGGDAGPEVAGDVPPAPEGDVDDAGCDAAEGDSGPDATSAGAAEFGQVHDP